MNFLMQATLFNKSIYSHNFTVTHIHSELNLKMKIRGHSPRINQAWSSLPYRADLLPLDLETVVGS